MNIIGWANERGLLKQGNENNQVVKLIEEVGELASSVLKKDHEKFKDSIGDCLVVLTILAHMNGLTLEECLDSAWNEIKDRKGETKDGIFIKDSI